MTNTTEVLEAERHTPGPWEVAEEHPNGVLDRLIKTGRYYVATVHDTASHPGCWDADARLIAAAPDMLSALETVDRFLDHLKNSWEVCGHTQAMMDSVKAAIAKTGAA